MPVTLVFLSNLLNDHRHNIKYENIAVAWGGTFPVHTRTSLWGTHPPLPVQGWAREPGPCRARHRLAWELTCGPVLSNDSEPWDFDWNYRERGTSFLLELLPQKGAILELVGACLEMEPPPKKGEVLECWYHVSLWVQPCPNFSRTQPNKFLFVMLIF